MSEFVVELNNDNFNKIIIQDKALALVDFWAEWCGPCRMAAPVVDEIAEQYQGKVVVGKVNIDDCREIAAKFNVMSIPTFIFFKDGEVKDVVVGLRGKGDLVEKIDQLLA